ncbi:MAG: polysaccharide deacetylase family protein [Bacteroidetes bacterium]|nr:polysaccharide deacetylase family protein [Bacteroidota bacterium]
MMIEIQNSFLPEKEYILRVLFKHYLRLEYTIKLSDTPHFAIILDNGRKLIFEDHFFSKAEDATSLFQKVRLPQNVLFVENQFATEPDVVVLYGNDKFQKGDNVHCGFDLISSAFFMLTRWEEMIALKRDVHDRLPDEESLAFKHGFYQRPIVNEYVEFIWNVLIYLGFEGKRKEHQFEAMVTHDIDELWRYRKFSRFLRAMTGDVLQRKSFHSLMNTIHDFVDIKSGNKPDNYDTFRMLMDLSEAENLKSRFYFIPGEPGEPDVRYSIHEPKVRAVIQEIVNRGHEVGLHASYAAFNDPQRFTLELDRLKQIQPEITGGRQHFLRHKNPDTYRLWEEHGLRYDSTLGFAFDAGFRAGTCFSFPVFDLVKREQLQLIEKPVTVMEVALRKKYNHPDDFMENMVHYINLVKKYQGEFVLIWHNSSFNTWEWNEQWFEIYKSTIIHLSR